MKNIIFSLIIFLVCVSSSVQAASWHSMGQGLDARYGHTFIYDRNSQTSILFGGIGFDERELGNLWEWTSTLEPWNGQKGSNYIIRGGSWNNFADYLRSSKRGLAAPTGRGGNLGFRLVRVSQP